ncbi:hypothetical protein FH972_023285 [Carpinus fangiana]|uniref:DUF726 domain-containing protein n=1 Tax=Carpinus fangiana TaxID=176857 RepID=A0A5N6KUR5_9ROSI|nr:hypothetical protein FH972_023285 [Carpinus fangiana]
MPVCSNMARQRLSTRYVSPPHGAHLPHTALPGPALPMFIRSRMPLQRKLTLCAIFGLGVFVILCAVLNKYYSFTNPFGREWENWYVREVSTAILVANLPFTWGLVRSLFRVDDDQASQATGGMNSRARSFAEQSSTIDGRSIASRDRGRTDSGIFSIFKGIKLPNLKDSRKFDERQSSIVHTPPNVEFGSNRVDVASAPTNHRLEEYETGGVQLHEHVTHEVPHEKYLVLGRPRWGRIGGRTMKRYLSHGRMLRECVDEGDCTDTMRTGIIDVFDPEKLASKPEKPNLDDITSALPNPEKNTNNVEDEDEVEELVLMHRQPSKDSLKANDVLDADPGSSEAKTAIEEAEQADLEAASAAKAAMTAEQRAEAKRRAAEEKARRDHEIRVKECASQNMVDLKTAALEHFDEWRAHVIERIGNAVNQQDGGASEKPEQEHHDTPVTTGEGEKTTKEQEEAIRSTEGADDKDVNTALHKLYPPHETLLMKLNAPHRILILHSLLLLLLGLERYSAESRILLLHVASSLHLPLSTVTADERKVAQGLLEVASKQMSADKETKKAEDKNVFSRRWKVGLGAVAGAALIGVTGGLAAPLLAAGIGSVMGGIGLGGTVAAGYLGALAGSGPLVGILFGAYGGRMTGKMVDQYAKEVSDFAFLPVDPAPTSRLVSSHQKAEAEARRLRVAIGISGWLTEEGEVVKPWRVLSPTGIEAFALRWELEALLLLGNSISVYAKSAAWGIAKTQIIKHTVFAALSTALWPLMALNAAQIVDNPFSVARARSDKAGRVLADALANRVQGERPVTLIGYGLGARMIYACLQTLAERRQFGLVESAVLAGAAAPADAAGWRKARTVVSGRLVNVYSSNDYLLGFLYRSTSVQLGIAGLQEVHDVAGVENVDASDAVDGHLKYRFITGTILKRIGLEDVDLQEVHRQEAELVKEEKKEDEEMKERIQRGKAEGKSEEDIVKEMEGEVQKKNEKTFLGKVGKGFNNVSKGMSDSIGNLKIGGKGRSEESVSGRSTPQERSSDVDELKNARAKLKKASVTGERS